MARSSVSAWKKAQHEFSEAIISCSEELTKTGRGVMRNACQSWLEKVDAEWPRGNGDYLHPWDTGALHDSIATRVSEDGHTIAISYMPSRSDEIQSATAMETGTRAYSRIVGSVFGAQMVRTAEMLPLSGTVGQMFIGAPYAEFVDNMASHDGYIEELENDFIDYIQEQFDKNNSMFRNLLVRPKK